MDAFPPRLHRLAPLVLLFAGLTAGAWALQTTDGSAEPGDEAQLFERTAQEMASRLLTVDFGREPDYPFLVEGSRRSLSALTRRLVSLGPQQLLSLAPPLEALELPEQGDPYLDAVARYQACHVYLQLDFDNPSEDEVGFDQRITAAMGPTYLDVTSRFLLDAYLYDGGSVDELRRFIDRPERQAVADRIASAPDLLAHSRGECHPVLESLFGADEDLSGMDGLWNRR